MAAIGLIFEMAHFKGTFSGDTDYCKSYYLKQNEKRDLNMHTSCQYSKYALSLTIMFHKITDL